MDWSNEEEKYCFIRHPASNAWNYIRSSKPTELK